MAIVGFDCAGNHGQCEGCDYEAECGFYIVSCDDEEEEEI